LKTTSDADLGTVFASLRSIMDEGLSMGVNLLNSAMNLEVPTALARLPKHSRCGCHIPPPCWMPIDLGRVTSHPCHGGTATLGIRVVNKSLATRTIQFSKGSGGPAITFTPATLSLGPMESGWVRASTAPPPHGDDDHEALIWVRGCREYYLHWHIRPVKRGADCCHEIEVEDGPELVHHWYDHFYCARPCTHHRA
jgi:hypothetical protein